MKDCDFCDNSKNEFTLVDEIVIMYGYQICNKCSDKNIGQTFIKKWFIYVVNEMFELLISPPCRSSSFASGPHQGQMRR